MKIKLTRLGLLTCAVLVAGSALAQKPPAGGAPPPGGGSMQRRGGQGGGGQRFMDQMVKDLGLTAAQKTKFEAIMKERRDKMRAMFQGQGQGRPSEAEMKAMRAKMQKIQPEFDKKMQKVLTAAQWKKYQALQKKRQFEMEKRMKAGGGMRPPGAPGGGGSVRSGKGG
jgi:Spy/CpxP family protein refolding chaperone